MFCVLAFVFHVFIFSSFVFHSCFPLVCTIITPQKQQGKSMLIEAMKVLIFFFTKSYAESYSSVGSDVAWITRGIAIGPAHLVMKIFLRPFFLFR